MKTIIRWIIRWLACRYLQEIDAVLREWGCHVHKNPIKRGVKPCEIITTGVAP